MKNREEIPEGIPDQIVVTHTLDLHGFFPEQVGEIVEAFIENALKLQLKQLKIIHGKGKSRLKFEAIQVLKNHPRVARFSDSSPESGSWGATIVELS